MEFGASLICLNQTNCHYLDMEHIYLGVKNYQESSNVTLWSVDNLDPSATHTISMELVNRFGDNATRIVAISNLEYTYFDTPSRSV